MNDKDSSMTIDQKEVERTLRGGGNQQDSVGDISESLSQLLDDLADEQQTKLFTELDKREIQIISALSAIDNPILDRFIDEFRSNHVSHKRRGRKELVDIADSLSGIVEMEKTGMTERLKQKLPGL